MGGPALPKSGCAGDVHTASWSADDRSSGCGAGAGGVVVAEVGEVPWLSGAIAGKWGVVGLCGVLVVDGGAGSAGPG